MIQAPERGPGLIFHIFTKSLSTYSILPSFHAPPTFFLHSCLPGLSSRLPNTTLTSTQPSQFFWFILTPPDSSCWVIIENNVYDVTEFLSVRPSLCILARLFIHLAYRSTQVAQTLSSSMQERTLRQRMSRFTPLTPLRSTCYHHSISVHSTQRQLLKL